MFFVFFLGVLSLLHLYLFRHLSDGWPEGALVSACILLVLLSLPFLMVLFKRHGHPGMARACARVGFTWIGVLFIGVCILALLDLYGLAASATGLSILSARTTVYMATGLTLAAVIYGVHEAHTPRLKRVNIQLSRSPDARCIRIVQISDLHLGYVVNTARLRKLVTRINALKPDLIVSTGDLFDSEFERMAPSVSILMKLRAARGKFAVSGNHEVYEDLDAGLGLTRRAGFNILKGESVAVTPELCLAGVDDAEALESGMVATQEAQALSGLPEHAYVILLKHRPTVLKSSVGHFDLQLSGHTHGGQIFPFSLLTRLVYRYGPGLSRVGEGSWIYLSRGTGTWGPQFRIMAPPEITLIELRAPL